MKKRKLFLCWSLLPSLTMVGATIMAILGWFGYMHRSDQTHLSYVILTIFTFATLWAGRLAWMLSKVEDTYGKDAPENTEAQAKLKYIDDRAAHGILAEKLCPLLGLLGTVWGFMMMFGDKFAAALGGDPDLAKEALGQMASGISTAFVTTGVGIACGAILLVQYYYIEYSVQRMKP